MWKRIRYAVAVAVLCSSFVAGGVHVSADSPVITEYPLPTGNYPNDIVTGPDGALWFTELNSGGIGRITTSGSITEYPIATPDSSPYGITVGPDGALWFAELGGNKIGRITTTGVITEYPVPTSASDPYFITTGPDGALWFSEGTGNKIGRITTAGVITEYLVPTPDAYPFGIVTGPDGALWFTESFSGKVGRITTSGTITEFSAASGNYPYGITVGPDNALWFPGSDGNNIFRITTSGVVSAFPVQSPAFQPYNITTGPDGALWFTDQGGNITRTTTSGDMTVYPTPTPSSLTWGITTGPDNNIWFTEISGNKIGRLVLSSSSDTTAPVLGTPVWSANPKPINGTTTLTVPVTDDMSGIQQAEYFLGDSDPGQGNGATMTVGGGNATTTFGTDFPTGVYKVSVRAQDTAGNWSAPTSDYLVVYDPAGPRMTAKRTIIPSLGNGDVLPGLISNGQTDKAKFGFSVKYNNQGQINSNSDLQFSYSTGTHCNNPAQAQNCHDLSLNATSIAWLTTSGTNNSTGIFQGVATVVVDGVTSQLPFRVTGVDGSRLSPTASDQFQIRIFAAGANPNTDSPLYTVNAANIAQGNIKIN